MINRIHEVKAKIIILNQINYFLNASIINKKVTSNFILSFLGCAI